MTRTFSKKKLSIIIIIIISLLFVLLCFHSARKHSIDHSDCKYIYNATKDLYFKLYFGAVECLNLIGWLNVLRCAIISRQLSTALHFRELSFTSRDAAA